MSSTKDKGNIAEREVLRRAREIADKDAHRVAGSGAGLDKNDIRLPNYNVEMEVKNQKTVSIKEWWRQLESQIDSHNTGALVFKIPQTSQYLTVLDLDDYLELLAQSKGEVEVSADFPPEMKFLVARLRDDLNKLKRYLENPE